MKEKFRPKNKSVWKIFSLKKKKNNKNSNFKLPKNKDAKNKNDKLKNNKDKLIKEINKLL